LISHDEWNANVDQWLPTTAERRHVGSLMTPVYEPGKMASWIAPPSRGINTKPADYDYVRL
jgi:benzoyl-CoA 2,3-dioxygenase component B